MFDTWDDKVKDFYSDTARCKPIASPLLPSWQARLSAEAQDESGDAGLTRM